MSFRFRALRPAWSLALAAVIGSVHVPRTAHAEEPKSLEAAKAEARERFDRGLKLFNQLDNEGALAEFTRAYELVPHAVVLYNIALVYAAMSKPVQAKEAFDRLLLAPAGLDPQKLERAMAERDQQAALIAEVEIASAVAGAQIEIDGIAVGKTPLSAPLKLASGSHIIGVVGSGYVPLRKQVTLAGNTRTKLDFELVLADAVLAHIDVRTRIPKLEVLLDGQFVGLTPLPASLAIVPGAHQIEARRVGYRTFSQGIEVGAGSTGAIDVNPDVDPTALSASGGQLELAISEPNAVVFIDGESRGQYQSPLILPQGEHIARVERADFFPIERRVTVPVRGRVTVTIELEPTPEKRARYRSATVARRTWGYVATAAGALIAGGGGGFLIWNSQKKSEKKDLFDAQAARHQPGGDCDPTMVQASTCDTELQLALDNLDSARKRDAYGIAGLIAGGALLGTGLVLLIGNDDPNRYEPKPESDVFANLRVTPSAWFTPGGSGVGLVGSF
ncbi:MAG TPA: PEGA domain-containing protein [Polyangiaceae bacterium]|nr:PEGA domain-containing protein [Polyangiaceae bacterium]